MTQTFTKMSDNDTLTVVATKLHESESEQSDEWNDALSDIYSPTHTSNFNYADKNDLDTASPGVSKPVNDQNQCTTTEEIKASEETIENDHQEKLANGCTRSHVSESSETSIAPWANEIRLRSPLNSTISRPPVKSFRLARVSLKPVGMSYLQNSQSTPNICQYVSNNTDMEKRNVDFKSASKQEQALKKVTFRLPKPKKLPEINEDGQPEWVRIANEKRCKAINWTKLELQPRYGSPPERKFTSLPSNMNNLEAIDLNKQRNVQRILTPSQKSPIAEEVSENPFSFVKLRPTEIQTDECKKPIKIKKPVWLNELKMKTAAMNRSEDVIKTSAEENISEIPQVKKGLHSVHKKPLNQSLNSGVSMKSSPSFESVLEQIKSFGKEKKGFNLKKVSTNLNYVKIEENFENASNVYSHQESITVSPDSHVKETISHTQFIITTDPLLSEETSFFKLSSYNTRNSSSETSEHISEFSTKCINDDSIVEDVLNSTSHCKKSTFSDSSTFTNMKSEDQQDTSSHSVSENNCSQNCVDIHENSQNEDDSQCRSKIVDKDSQHFQDFHVEVECNTGSDEEKSTVVRDECVQTENRSDYSTFSKESTIDLKSPALVMKILPSLKKFSSDTNLSQVGYPFPGKRRFSDAFYQMTSSCTDLLSQMRFTKPNFSPIADAGRIPVTKSREVAEIRKDEQLTDNEICRSEIHVCLSDNSNEKQDSNESTMTQSNASSDLSSLSLESNGKEYAISSFKNNGEYIWKIGGLDSGNVHEKCTTKPHLEVISREVVTKEEECEVVTLEEEMTTVVTETSCTSTFDASDEGIDISSTNSTSH